MGDLSGVLPGWRGTDPDGGTWVLTDAPGRDLKPWLEVTANGDDWHWRSQEEAEAAGLVPLRADGPASALIRAGADATRPPRKSAPAPLDGALITDQVIEEFYKDHDECADFELCDEETMREYVGRAVQKVAPAPLDPGNPEHLRAYAAASYRLAALLPGTQDGETLEMAAGIAEWRAECLDRERAEAGQEAAEAAKLAAVLADFSIYDTDGSRDDAILAGASRAPWRARHRGTCTSGGGTVKHLWEYDHPYYAEDGCYFTPGTRWHEVHTAYPSCGTSWTSGAIWTPT